jgi:hypothetical protein
MTRATLILCAALLAGCASWAERGVPIAPPRKLKVAVLPVSFGVRIRKMTDIETVPKGTRPPRGREEAEISSATAALSDAMRASFADGLDKSWYFRTVASTADADAVLRVTVLGYGRIKRSWVFLLLGSGMVEGAVQGVAVAEAAGSVPAAIGVAGEEALQETVEDVGGVFLFDRWFTPVFLKAELVSPKGRVVWRGWAWGDRDRKGVKKLPQAGRRLKQKRLWLVFAKAETSLLRKLGKAAARNAG